jgi:hypothetical protein
MPFPQVPTGHPPRLMFPSPPPSPGVGLSGRRELRGSIRWWSPVVWGIKRALKWRDWGPVGAIESPASNQDPSMHTGIVHADGQDSGRQRQVGPRYAGSFAQPCTCPRRVVPPPTSPGWQGPSTLASNPPAPIPLMPVDGPEFGELVADPWSTRGRSWSGDRATAWPSRSPGAPRISG